MIFSKNWFQERKRLKQFKKDIRGLFNEWSGDQYSIQTKDGKYKLWINGAENFFRDYEDCSESFLSSFTKKEKSLLWQEIVNKSPGKNRKSIFKEFNLTY